MANSLVKELIDAGIHFGHRVSRWNPKMAPYIFGKRNLIHIIDVKETLRGLLRAQRFLRRLVSDGKNALFVGTKRQARQAVQREAERTAMPYVTERWLGGTLTNFRTIRSRLSRLEELEAMEADGTLNEYSKKMISTLTRERRKIHRNLSGIRAMGRIPGCLILIDPRKEHIAIQEARKLHIPTIALMDTDSDPDMVDVPIPGNDDAMRAIDLICKCLGDAIMEGKAGRVDEPDAGPSRAPRKRRAATSEKYEKAEKPAPAPAEPKVETPAAPEPEVETPAAPAPEVETPAAPEPEVETPAAPEPEVETPAAPEPEAKAAEEVAVVEAPAAAPEADAGTTESAPPAEGS